MGPVSLPRVYTEAVQFGLEKLAHAGNTDFLRKMAAPFILIAGDIERIRRFP
jgi:hypothetical protein